MVRIPASRQLSKVGPFAWIVLAALLTLGIVSTAIDLSMLPREEISRANASGQRAVIDPVTGGVSLNTYQEIGKDHAFEVSDSAKDALKKSPTAAASITPAKPKEEVVTAAATVPQGQLPKGLPELRSEPFKAPMPNSTQADRLVSAPAPEVSERLEGLVLPRRGSDKLTPASLYAHRFTRTPKQELLSVVILNAGLSPQSLPLIHGLPKEVSVAVSPYIRDPAIIAGLRSAGFETWGMLPTMTDHYPQDDPGPLGLIGTQPRDEITRRTRTVLAQTIGAVGMVLLPNDALISKPVAYNAMLNEIASRGLFLLSTHPNRTLEQISGDKAIQPLVRRTDLEIDAIPDEAQIESKLASLPDLLHSSGTVIVYASDRPQTLLALQRWFQAHPLAEPQVLAPLSAQWQPKEPPAAEEKKEDPKENAAASSEKKPEEKKEEKRPDDKKAESK